MLPAVVDFTMESSSICIIKFADLVNMVRTLCNQCALDQIWGQFADLVLRSEILDVCNQLIPGYTNQGVLDSKMC